MHVLSSHLLIMIHPIYSLQITIRHTGEVVMLFRHFAVSRVVNGMTLSGVQVDKVLLVSIRDCAGLARAIFILLRCCCGQYIYANDQRQPQTRRKGRADDETSGTIN
ncbi:hypothetical protein B0H13DRAFT_2155509 [Mycena leptocephala]|nr:hypothetical protein B0H13DRAFT_2155509 [Mycena leptocephala]